MQCKEDQAASVVYVCNLSSAEPKNELFLFYGKGRPGIVRGMDLNTKIADEYMIPIENLVNPRAIDFHAETNYIYFADTTSFLIGRQKIDGTERETILKDGKWQYVTLTLNCPEIKHFKRINLVYVKLTFTRTQVTVDLKIFVNLIFFGNIISTYFFTHQHIKTFIVKLDLQLSSTF